MILQRETGGLRKLQISKVQISDKSYRHPDLDCDKQKIISWLFGMALETSRPHSSSITFHVSKPIPYAGITPAGSLCSGTKNGMKLLWVRSEAHR